MQKSLEAMRVLLKDRRLDHIQDATGINRATLSRIRDDPSYNTSYETARKLSDYFEGQEQKAQAAG